MPEAPQTKSDPKALKCTEDRENGSDPAPKPLKSTLNLPIGGGENTLDPAQKPLKSTLNLPIGGGEITLDPAPKPLKSTLNLPQTPFPMKANLPDNEPKRLAAWQQQSFRRGLGNGRFSGA